MESNSHDPLARIKAALGDEVQGQGSALVEDVDLDHLEGPLDAESEVFPNIPPETYKRTLERIADALERIAAHLENPFKP